MTFAERERLVRASYAAWSAGDFDSLVAIYHRECEWDNSRLGLPDVPSISRGHAEMLEFWRTSVGAFGGTIHAEPLEIAELPDDRVAVTGAWKAPGGERAGALDAVAPFGQIVEFRDGLISRVEYFPDPDEARTAGAR